MLLFFWKAAGLGAIGTINYAKAVHRQNYPIRCLCTGDSGFLTFNPFLDNSLQVCSQAFTGLCTSIDLYGDDLLIGTASGIISMPWESVVNSGCDVNNPNDLTSSVVDKYSTVDGLLSNSILNITAKKEYLAVVTSSGLSWKKDSDFINYPTVSGRDVFIDFDGSTYLAEDTQLKIKYGEPANFSSWDVVLDFASPINSVFVEEDQWGENRAIFVGTVSGAYIINGQDTSSIAPITTSGSPNITRIVAEPYSCINSGHLFIASKNAVNIYNIKAQRIDTVAWSDSGSNPLIAFDHVRLFSN